MALGAYQKLETLTCYTKGKDKYNNGMRERNQNED